MIKSILQEKRKNLGGIEYPLFNSKQRDIDMEQLESIFSKYLEAIKNMCPNLTENEINDNFKRTMKEISFIRLDETDMQIPPIILSTSEFIHKFMRGKTEKEQIANAEKIINRHPLFARHFMNKKKMDATTRAYDVKSGIGIFAPALKTSQKKKTREEQLKGEQILLHEFLHASSAWKITENGEEFYRQGVRIHEKRGVYDDFNEGLNEYFTFNIMKKMYPNDNIHYGYRDRVEMIKQMMSKLSKQEREEIFSLYISGEGKQIIEIFKTKVNADGKSIYDYFEYYQKNGVGLGGGVSPVNGKTLPLFGDVIEACLENSLTIPSI